MTNFDVLTAQVMVICDASRSDVVAGLLAAHASGVGAQAAAVLVTVSGAVGRQLNPRIRAIAEVRLHPQRVFFVVVLSQGQRGASFALCVSSNYPGRRKRAVLSIMVLARNCNWSCKSCRWQSLYSRDNSDGATLFIILAYTLNFFLVPSRPRMLMVSAHQPCMPLDYQS